MMIWRIRRPDGMMLPGERSPDEALASCLWQAQG
jgi:hypothetical protein